MFFQRCLLLVGILGGVLGKVDLCSNLVQPVFCLSLGEKLVLSETRNAKVLEETVAWTQFRCLNSRFSCVFLHFMKQKSKKYIHDDVFA